LALFVKSAAASTASGPNVRDDGQRPSLKDRTAADMKVICVEREQKYFLQRDWTGPSQNSALICPSG
jgi:hypothetical protein